MTWSPAPADLDEVLSPAWLSVALSERYPGTVVTGVELLEEETRLSTNALFRIDGPDLPADLPRSLVVKGYFKEHMRDSLFLGYQEGGFYRLVAPHAPVRMLTCAYAGVDESTRHGVIITANLHEAGGSFLDALSPYSVDQVAASLEQLAILHGSTRRAPWLLDLHFMDPRMHTYLEFRGIEPVEKNFGDDEISGGAPDEVKDAHRLARALTELDRRSKTEERWSVIHGDAHVGNFFLDKDGLPGLLDFQVTQRGLWYIDVGYHLGSALPVETRRGAERDLVAHYLDRLAATGAQAPGWDEAWEGYRAGLVYGYYMWAATLLVKRPIIATLVTRLGTAVADHNSLGLLAP